MQDILIVEDGLHERERLHRLFSAAQFTVRCAENAEEAERLLESSKFRLVVLDIGLEDKSGSHLFQQICSADEVPYVIVLTGNPSAHLKQRFLDEGAAAYIVKASPAAANEALLSTVQSLLGTVVTNSGAHAAKGLDLREFLRIHVVESSQNLFLDVDDQFPPCAQCGCRSYVVTFNHKTQLPPLLEGKAICVDCGADMDPELG